jgi:hypothetical protein
MKDSKSLFEQRRQRGYDDVAADYKVLLTGLGSAGGWMGRMMIDGLPLGVLRARPLRQHESCMTRLSLG